MNYLSATTAVCNSIAKYQLQDSAIVTLQIWAVYRNLANSGYLGSFAGIPESLETKVANYAPFGATLAIKKIYGLPNEALA